MAEVLRWWRQYRTSSGSMPVREFVDALHPQDSEAIRAAMRDVALFGRSAAVICAATSTTSGSAGRSTRGGCCSLRREGRHHLLLALSAFEKKTQKTTDRELELA